MFLTVTAPGGSAAEHRRLTSRSADVPAGAAAAHAAALPPAPDPTRRGWPAAALLPPLDPALLQERVPRHRSTAHVGGLLGTLPGQDKVRAAPLHTQLRKMRFAYAGKRYRAIL